MNEAERVRAFGLFRFAISPELGKGLGPGILVDKIVDHHFIPNTQSHVPDN